MIKTIRKEVDKPLNSTNIQQQWSEKQKYEAVALYKLLGSLAEVARQTGIPRSTLKQWHLKDWWKDIELELVQGTRSKLSAKMERVRDQAIAVVEDRLANGDFVYNQKTGEIVRKPVNAQIANKIMTDTIDKSLLIEKLNHEQKVSMTVEKMSDRLILLHDEFTRMARKQGYKPQGEVFDAEVIQDAVHDSGEAGLQAGAGEREEERTEPGQGTLGTESSSPSGD